MAIPKKNSRSITVGGRNYRWLVKSLENERVRLTVQDEVSGELHQRTFTFDEDVIRGCPDVPRVTPANVKEFILYRFPQSA